MLRRVIKTFKDDGLKARAMRGAGLTIISVGGGSFLRLASNLLLTRLLFPEAFGLMALVGVVLGSANMFSNIGIREAIIQDARGDEKEFLETAWTLQIVRGIILSLCVFMLAGPVSRFYGEEILFDMLRVAALVPLVQGFVSIGLYSANREMLLGKLTWLVLGTQLLGIIVMLILAVILNSVWALVIGGVVTAVSHAGFSHMLAPSKSLKLRFEGNATGRILHYGKYIVFSTVAAFFVNQGDKVVLGKYVTLEELAIYNIAFFLATFPLIFNFTLNDHVIFPLYARRPPSASEENRRKINNARMSLTGLLIAGIALLAFISDPLIKFLYDSRYHSAGPILILIALATIPRLIVLSYEKLPLAFGNSGRYAVYVGLTGLIQFGLTVYGVQNYGLIGAIAAPAITTCVAYPILLFIIHPFKGWSALHDLLYATVAVAVSSFILWYYWDLVSPLFP